MIDWNSRTKALRGRLKKLLELNCNGVVLQLASLLDVNPKILKSFIFSGIDGSDEYQITAKTYNQIVTALSKSSLLFTEADFSFIVESISRSPNAPDLSFPITYEDDELDRIILMQYYFMGGDDKKLRSECSIHSKLKNIPSKENRIIGLVEAVKIKDENPIQRLQRLRIYREVLDDIKIHNSVSVFSVNMDEYLWNDKNEYLSHFYLAVLDWWHSIKDKKMGDLDESDYAKAKEQSYDIEKRGFMASLDKYTPAKMTESKRPTKK
jgi:hypothetical protein